MPTEVYPFFKIANGIYRPIVPIRVYNPLNRTSNPITVGGLLDTGADDCMFPRFVADVTGHNLKASGVTSKINQGIGAAQVQTWLHTFKIELLKPDGKTVFWQSPQFQIACVDHDSCHPLLGWVGFLSNFKTTFNYSTKRIIIEIMP
jgi:hypothetical protein